MLLVYSHKRTICVCMKTWLKISFEVFAHANFKFILGKPPKQRFFLM